MFLSRCFSKLEKTDYIPIQLTPIFQNRGSIYLSQAPGKNIQKGRNGKCYLRDLLQDLKYFKENSQITTIVCLLNKYELRTIGVDIEKYQKICSFLKIDLILFPIIEMCAPNIDAEALDMQIISKLANKLEKNENMVIHCRGGIGRAALIGCCLLLEINEKKNSLECLQFVRKVRDKRCIETKKQFDYLVSYEKYLQGKK